MEPRPLFTVITVTLNCREAALATAGSVLSQTYRSFEYVIKDGGSTDSTVEALRGRGLAVHAGRDAGIYDAMNRALAWCGGEYVLFLNAGDVFVDSQVLSRLAEAIRAQPAADLYYGDLIMDLPHPYAPPAQGRRLKRRVLNPARLSRFYLYRRGLCHQACLVRRELYLRDPFDVRLTLMADYDFLLKAAFRRKTRMRHIPSLIADYQGGGRSEQLHAQWLLERRQLVQEYFSPAERFIYATLRLTARWMLTAAYRLNLFSAAEESLRTPAWTI
jgi:putative colanic acid biosynthesis glycosyltransferase